MLRGRYLAESIPTDHRTYHLQDDRPKVQKGPVRALETLINHAVQVGFLSLVIRSVKSIEEINWVDGGK